MTVIDFEQYRRQKQEETEEPSVSSEGAFDDLWTNLQQISAADYLSGLCYQALDGANLLVFPCPMHIVTKEDKHVKVFVDLVASPLNLHIIRDDTE